MPTRQTAPIGAPCWVDLMTSDTDATRVFYPALLGWVAEEASPEFGGYFMFTRDGLPMAGCMPSPEDPDAGPSNVWSVYLASDDAEKTLEAVTAKGGQVLVPPMAVADLGSMAVVADAGGAAVGVWQPGTFPGLTVLGETNTPAWFELQTRAYTATLDFYREVFHWNTAVMSDTDDFRYSVQADGDDQLAGVMDAAGFLPEGVPAHWSVYFAVEDTDAALARAVELGGSIVLPAEDTPYGRLATVADPGGAAFKLVAPDEAMPAR